MTTAFDSIAHTTQSDNPFFAPWGRPSNGAALVIDHILASDEAFMELLTGDYSANGDEAQRAVTRWANELMELKGPASVLGWDRGVQVALFGEDYVAEVIKDAAERFQVIREEFDSFVSSRISTLVNIEAAISWLKVLVEEVLARNDLHEDDYRKLAVLKEYKRAFQHIATMDQLMISKLQGMELLMAATAAKLVMVPANPCK